MSKTYKFSTFKELFDTVPANRIEVCLKELVQLIVATKEIERKIYDKVKNDKTVDLSKPLVIFPEVIEWIDDNKGNIDLNLICKGEDKPINIKIK